MVRSGLWSVSLPAGFETSAITENAEYDNQKNCKEINLMFSVNLIHKDGTSDSLISKNI
jgi:hypothetical protein